MNHPIIQSMPPNKHVQIIFRKLQVNAILFTQVPDLSAFFILLN